MPEPAYFNVDSARTQKFHYKGPKPFLLDHGGELPEFDLAYETWGALNHDHSNAIMIFTGLSASSHACSTGENPDPGWWEGFIGPGKPIDTSRFFVCCANVLGGCHGSTGPWSMKPDGSGRYATWFPTVTIWDMVRAQFLLLDHLRVYKLHAAVGASMGGMQSLVAAVLFPERMKSVTCISACLRTHPFSVAFRHAQRQALMSDPDWNRGNYYDGKPPLAGMKLARQIATISYRSSTEWALRFGRRRGEPNSIALSRTSPSWTPALCPDFAIENYLEHQGDRFLQSYDANSLLYLSKAMDLFSLSDAPSCIRPSTDPPFPLPDPSQRTDWNDLSPYITALQRLQHLAILLIGVQSDMLFPISQQKEIYKCLKAANVERVTYYEIDSLFGHDTFLLDLASIGAAIRGHLQADCNT